MSEYSADDPFEDCELGPEATLRTRTFEDILFTGVLVYTADSTRQTGAVTSMQLAD